MASTMPCLQMEDNPKIIINNDNSETPKAAKMINNQY